MSNSNDARDDINANGGAAVDVEENVIVSSGVDASVDLSPTATASTVAVDNRSLSGDTAEVSEFGDDEERNMSEVPIEGASERDGVSSSFMTPEEIRASVGSPPGKVRLFLLFLVLFIRSFIYLPIDGLRDEAAGCCNNCRSSKPPSPLL